MAVDKVRAESSPQASQCGRARSRIPGRPGQVERAVRRGKSLARWPAQDGQARANVAGWKLGHEVERHALRASPVESGDDLQHAQPAVVIHIQRRVVNDAQPLERYAEDFFKGRSALLPKGGNGDGVQED
jgi:hypothetical protein